MTVGLIHSAADTSKFDIKMYASEALKVVDSSENPRQISLLDENTEL